VRDPRKCYRIFFVRCFFGEAYSTSCGSSWTGETPQTRSVEEAHRSPRGKRAAWSGNQRTALIGQKQQFIRKEPNENKKLHSHKEMQLNDINTLEMIAVHLHFPTLVLSRSGDKSQNGLFFSAKKLP
jgi:hypothetical protein